MTKMAGNGPGQSRSFTRVSYMGSGARALEASSTVSRDSLAERRIGKGIARTGGNAHWKHSLEGLTS